MNIHADAATSFFLGQKHIVEAAFVPPMSSAGFRSVWSWVATSIFNTKSCKRAQLEGNSIP